MEIRTMFENFWKVKSLRKDIKEKDKELYYDLFLDGYACAILNMQEKEENSQEAKSEDVVGVANRKDNHTLEKSDSSPDALQDVSAPKVKRKYEACNTCGYTRQAHDDGNTFCKKFQEPDNHNHSPQPQGESHQNGDGSIDEGVVTSSSGDSIPNKCIICGDTECKEGWCPDCKRCYDCMSDCEKDCNPDKEEKTPLEEVWDNPTDDKNWNDTNPDNYELNKPGGKK